MSMRRIVYILFILLAIGCIAKPDYVDGYRPRLVVDGSIETGRGAVVALSQTIPFEDHYSEEDFRDMVIRWAKVTVECGDRHEVLVGRSNEDYPTRFIYTGSEIVGRAGESYTLVVEYSGHIWRATTTIPEPIVLEDVRREIFSDTLCTITATLPPCTTPCAVDCALGGSSYFAPTLLGVYDADDKPRRVTVNRPMDNLYRQDYDVHFSLRDTVALKLRTMGQFAYDYWNLWQNNVINSLNPVFPAVDNLPTNISGGAVGIWAGYGSSVYVLRD